MRVERKLVNIRPTVFPTDKKMKKLPAVAWLRASSSSIIGRTGEKMVRLEKLRNQRLQKTKRRRSFMMRSRLIQIKRNHNRVGEAVELYPTGRRGK